MAVDYTAIHTEVTTGAQYASAYAAKDVQAIQAIYNAVKVNGNIPTVAFVRWSAINNLRGVIQDLANNTASPLRSSALALIDVLRGASNGLDLSDSANIGMLNGWVTAGAITAAQETALIALSQTPRNVSIQDLAFALYQPNGTVK